MTNAPAYIEQLSLGLREEQLDGFSAMTLYKDLYYFLVLLGIFQHLK